jgi:hypothetical protein
MAKCVAPFCAEMAHAAFCDICSGDLCEECCLDARMIGAEAMDAADEVASNKEEDNGKSK